MTDYMAGAGNYLDVGAAEGKQYLDPYRKAGLEGMGQYQEMLGRMQDPSFYNQMMSGFELDPSQKYAQEQGESAISSNAALHGLMGSQQQAKELQRYATDTTGAAQDRYYHNVLDPYKTALSGYGGMMHQGYDASGKMADIGMRRAEDRSSLNEMMAQKKTAQEAQQSQSYGQYAELAAMAIMMMM